MITIDVECKQKSLMPVDLDHMSQRYTTTNGLFSFQSPSLWVIEKNLFYLLKNSIVKAMETKYIMKPDYLSYDEYGMTDLSYLLMYVNNVFCIEDFTMTSVVIPEMRVIVEMCSGKYSNRHPDEYPQVGW